MWRQIYCIVFQCNVSSFFTRQIMSIVMHWPSYISLLFHYLLVCLPQSSLHLCWIGTRQSHVTHKEVTPITAFWKMRKTNLRSHFQEPRCRLYQDELRRHSVFIPLLFGFLCLSLLSSWHLSGGTALKLHCALIKALPHDFARCFEVWFYVHNYD